MLNTHKLRNLYAKIQTQLFYIIPEKWDKIYLYASVMEKANHIETGEMFFYYYPKGLLKKNPVNVYEVPAKFNIDENSYMELVDKLYETIKLLREEFENTEEKVWTNLTISIENLKFHIEYNYENLLASHYTNYDRHIIWQYKYLELPIERLSKKDREMLEEYLLQEKFQNTETKNYTEGMYKNNIHNIVEYNREQTESLEEEKMQEEKENLQKEEKKLDKYELYKRKQEEQKQREKEMEEQKEKRKNQILNY